MIDMTMSEVVHYMKTGFMVYPSPEQPKVEQYLLDITPVGAARPRVTKTGHTFYPKIYSAYKKKLVDMLKSVGFDGTKWAGKKVQVDVCFVLPLPTSYTVEVEGVKKSKAYRKAELTAMAGTYCGNKPDRDNLDKGLLDALLPEDSLVVCGWIQKVWDKVGGKGCIWFSIQEANVVSSLPDSLKQRFL